MVDGSKRNVGSEKDQKKSKFELLEVERAGGMIETCNEEKVCVWCKQKLCRHIISCLVLNCFFMMQVKFFIATIFPVYQGLLTFPAKQSA